ncbi:uncharacterized protein L199_005110 [Kwoniella botswanensis]|uniref:uncharacterized protein n=1 Tax=Kwoniella botswanensis TaxID=1268659 RepID=UPI00315DC806
MPRSVNSDHFRFRWKISSNQFTNGDTYLPLPSFHPHIQNWASDIDPANINGLSAFRLTCRKFHQEASTRI